MEHEPGSSIDLVADAKGIASDTSNVMSDMLPSDIYPTNGRRMRDPTALYVPPGPRALLAPGSIRAGILQVLVCARFRT